VSEKPGRKGRLTHKTKKDFMAESLRDAIFSGEIRPGERLLQEELAERFHVSPTPVREAIQQLVAEGVLSHSPYRGVQVTEPLLEEAHEIYLIRGAVERLATKVAVPNLKISDVQRLRAIQAEMADNVEHGDRELMHRLNHEFHMTIYTAADMPLLLRIIKTLWIKSPWNTLFVISNRSRMILEEHQRVLTAIEQGDAELAGQAMQQHLEKGAAALTEHLKAMR
jgi:DNA-binding GntR family transcriptional regulator